MPRKHLLLSLSIIIVIALVIAAWNIPLHNKSNQEVDLQSASNYAYRDLNKNGKLDIYEDSKQPIDARIDDVLRQMTLEEKAGMMFINGAKVNEDGSIEDKPATGMFAFTPNGLKLMRDKKMNHFNLWAIP
jgi:beta-glucosidase